MKKGKYITLLSAIAILILIGIETLLVIRIYRLQAEKFDYRYREILQKGLDFIEGRPDNLGLNDMYLLMEGLSAKLLDIYNNKEIDTLSYRKIALRQFHSILVNKQELDVYLKEYLQKRQEDTDFKSHFLITNISLYNVDEIVDLYHAKTDSSWIYRDTLVIPSRLLPVYHYSHSGDRFEIGLNYFVDFSNKKAIVLREIAGSLLFSILAIISIGLMFLYTLRNLMEERRLSELKTDFINNMTHELKTPLSTISIATRTLENDSVLSDKEKARQTVSVIHRQNRQLSRQINHLLEISMWERKQFSLDRKTVDLGPFFSGIAESFRWECKDKKCRITEEYHLKTEKASLDEVQMTVVLHNLLANACKYNINEPEIGLQVWCDDSLKIAVTDNGIGIGREDQKHIFDKFYRVSTGNIHKVKGLGLGLFYVKQIVEAHGGTVDLSSRPGKGSTFTLNLPVNGKNQNSSR